jgi:predicted acyltransferase
MKSRLLSVDVFRGLTVILMTIVNNPGNWDHVYAPFLHAEWHGCTLTDLVFPFFLFIVGISVVLANPKKENSINQDLKIITRFCRIFGLGLFLSFFSNIQFGGLSGINLLLIRLVFTAIIVSIFMGEFKLNLKLGLSLFTLMLMFVLAFWGPKEFENVRIPGVLQRIALVYLVISFLYARFELKALLGFCGFFLLSYFLLMTYVDVPGFGPANLEKGTNLAAWFDNLVLENHLWAVSKTWDPEGILSTIPAFSTGLLGVFVGLILISNQKNKTLSLFKLGIALTILGWAWSQFFPINKALWTSSFVCYTAGLGTLLLGLLFFLIDENNSKSWTKPFVVFGVNPMVIFFFSGIIPRALSMIKINAGGTEEEDFQGFLYNSYIASYIDNPYAASLTGAFVYLAIWYLILSLFYKKNLIFKV